VGAAKNILDKVIYYHSKEEILELASVAAQTNFNLKEKTDIEYIEKEAKENLGKGLKVLGEQGVDPKLIKQIKHKYKI
jgi:ABC-type microcin C transport system permease subunit YejB